MSLFSPKLVSSRVGFFRVGRPFVAPPYPCATRCVQLWKMVESRADLFLEVGRRPFFHDTTRQRGTGLYLFVDSPVSAFCRLSGVFCRRLFAGASMCGTTPNLIISEQGLGCLGRERAATIGDAITPLTMLVVKRVWTGSGTRRHSASREPYFCSTFFVCTACPPVSQVISV